MEPLENHIKNKEREWNLRYAQAEWLWYASADPSIKALGETYMVKYHQYGNVWLTKMVKLTLTMVGN